jgi:hypothetical protein
VEAVTAVLEQAQLDQRLDEKDADWAISVLRGVNYKKLSQLMEELIAQVGDMGQELLAAVPDLPVLLARARTGVSHGGAMKGPNALGRYWLGEALIWVLRVRLLAELGVPVSDLSAYVIQKTAFQEALHELVRLRPGADKPKNQ